MLKFDPRNPDLGLQVVGRPSPTKDYIWQYDTGPDGWIYGCTYPQAKLVRFRPGSTEHDRKKCELIVVDPTIRTVSSRHPLPGSQVDQKRADVAVEFGGLTDPGHRLSPHPSPQNQAQSQGHQ